MEIKDKFEEEYRPLMDLFIERLSLRPFSDYQGIPHPFLPAWGKNYHHALIRIAIIGKETRGWAPNLDEFIKLYKNQKYDFGLDREEFQNLDFTNNSWMGDRPTRASFWGFWMNVLAKTYGIVDWEEIKHRRYDVLLDSFLWGNANAIETVTSAGVNPNAPGYWDAKNESKVFDSIHLIQRVFDPHVIILTCARSEMQSYLKNDFIHIETIDGCVSVLRKDKSLIFHAPHPNRQRWDVGGSDKYAKIMRNLLYKYKLFCPLPNSLQQGLSAEAKEILIRECSITKMNKFEAIARIAHELRKQRSFLTARSLCVDILNQAGHRTNIGTEYTGNGKGLCRLCATAYHRFIDHEPQIAEDIALAFTQDNGFYAYE